MCNQRPGGRPREAGQASLWYLPPGFPKEFVPVSSLALLARPLVFFVHHRCFAVVKVLAGVPWILQTFPRAEMCFADGAPHCAAWLRGRRVRSGVLAVTPTSCALSEARSIFVYPVLSTVLA